MESIMVIFQVTSYKWTPHVIWRCFLSLSFSGSGLFILSSLMPWSYYGNWNALNDVAFNFAAFLLNIYIKHVV